MRSKASSPFTRIAVLKEEGIPFSDGGAPPPTWNVLIMDKVAYVTGTKWVGRGASLIVADTEAEARRRGADLLRLWADELEADL